jgi:hypothetical protein
MPKVDAIYDTNLGNVKMPSHLMTQLEEYCKSQHMTKSHAVRAALAHQIGADLSAYVEIAMLRDQNR